MTALLRLAVLLLLFASSLVSGAERPARFADYHRDVWTAREGAPPEIMMAVQTTDGWLWLSTPNGLYRFDGVKFEEFRPYPGEALLRKRLAGLVALRNGDLVIGYGFGGLSVLRKGRLIHYTGSDGGGLGGLYKADLDIDGSLWAATARGLFHLKNGKWRKIGAAEGFDGTHAECVLLDQYGQLWAANDHQLFKLDRSSGKFQPTGIYGNDGGLIATPDGQLWFISTDKVTPVDMGPQKNNIERDPHFGPMAAHEGLFDGAGNYWGIHCGTGLCWMPSGSFKERKEFSTRTMKPILPPAQTNPLQRWNTLLEDREGNIWVSSQMGLERYRPNRVESIPFAQPSRFHSIASDGPDNLWVVTKPAGVLWHYANGKSTMVSDREVYSIAMTLPDGSTLVSGNRHLERRSQGKVHTTPLPPAADGRTRETGFGRMAYDGASIWGDLHYSGVYRLTDGAWTSAKELGIAPNSVAMAANTDGHLWLGYVDNKLIVYKEGRMREYGPADGVDLGSIAFIHAEDDVFIAGDHGAAILIDGRFHRLLLDDMSLLPLISGVAITPDGDRWLNSPKGMLHIRRADWQQLREHPERLVKYEIFNSSDGYTGAALVKQTPLAIGGQGEKLWLASPHGIVRLDTTQLRRNRLAPSVEITALRANGVLWRTDQPPTLAPGTRNLTVEFTALSYTMPERVQLQYQLEGVDRDWQRADQRAAHYTKLDPGQYQFRVRAANEDGVWNEQGAVLDFTIEPSFYQTRWFTVMCLLGALTGMYLLYIVRVRISTQRIAARLQERVDERERIARALHDTFLQSVQALILRFQVVADRLPAGGDLRPMMEAVLQEADQVVAEGRDQVMNLRTGSDESGSLEQSLRELGASWSGTYSTGFSVSSTGERTLTPVVREEVFYIAQEALLNAMKHAHAGQVELDIVYGVDYMTMHVRDDGLGIDEAVCRAGGRPGHWGLTGMRERAVKIGGELDIRSEPGAGTEIALTVPASIAYVAAEPVPA